MTQEYRESELVFEFPDDTKWRELDQQGVTLPVGMALVDLVIERENDFLLVEIKDPSDSKAKAKDQNKYLKRLHNDSVLKDELTPKCRDSYTYQHLMEQDNKPFIYIVLLGLDAFSAEVQKALLQTFSDRLFRSVKHEAVIPWKRTHIKDCKVLAIDGWNRYFSHWPVRREAK